MVLLNPKDPTGNKSITFSETKCLNSRSWQNRRWKVGLVLLPAWMSASRSPSQEPPTKVLTAGLRKGLALVTTTSLDPFFHMGGIERDGIAETGEALSVCPK